MHSKKVEIIKIVFNTYLDILTGIKVNQELQRWGLGFNDRMVELQGHVIPPETIIFGGARTAVPDNNYDWFKAFRGKPPQL